MNSSEFSEPPARHISAAHDGTAPAPPRLGGAHEPGTDADPLGQGSEGSLRAESKAARGLLLVILTVAAWLRFSGLGSDSLWLDEVLQVTLSTLPFGEVANGVREIELMPPLFHYILHFWIRVFGQSEVVVRAPAALIGIASVWAAYRLAREVFGPLEGLVAAGLLAISPYQIHYSQEARSYSLFVLLTLLSCWAWYLTIQRGERRHQVAFVTTTALLLYTHLYGIFLIVAQNLAWLASLGRTQRASVRPRQWILLNVAVATAFLPWVPQVLAGLQSVSGGIWIPSFGLEMIPLAYLGYTGRPTLAIALWVFALCGAVYSSNRSVAVLLLAAATLPVVVPVLVSVALRPIFWHRYGIGAAAVLTILAARGVAVAPGRRLRAALLVVLGVFALGSAFAPQFGAPTRPDWRGAMALIQERATPSDAVFLHVGHHLMAAEYYLRGSGLEVRVVEESPDPRDLSIVGTIWLISHEPVVEEDGVRGAGWTVEESWDVGRVGVMRLRAETSQMRP